MKVGLVRRGYSPVGGAEAYLKRLARALSEKGHEPVLFGSPHWPEADWPGANIIRISGESPRAFADDVAKRRSKVDVLLSLERIHSCDVYRAGDGVHASWLKRRARFEPWWQTVFRHVNRKHAALLALERSVFSASHTRRIIANSRMVAQEIQELYGFPASRIDVIENGVDASSLVTSISRKEARTNWRLADDSYVALFAGSGWKRKGLAYVLAAARTMPSMTLIVAGKDPIPRNAPTNVRFVGPQRSLESLFAAADVFVLPTLYDPFSNACLEAFAAGLPVITSRSNGFSEIITPGTHGEIIDDPSDIGALSAALKKWETPGRAAGARETNHQHAQVYSIERNTQLTLDSLASAIHG